MQHFIVYGRCSEPMLSESFFFMCTCLVLNTTLILYTIFVRAYLSKYLLSFASKNDLLIIIRMEIKNK